MLALWFIVFFNPKIFYNTFIQSKWMVIYILTILLIVSESLKIKKSATDSIFCPSDDSLKIIIFTFLSSVVISSVNVSTTLLIPSLLDWCCGLIIVSAIFKQLEQESNNAFFSLILKNLILISLMISAYFIVFLDKNFYETQYTSHILKIFFGNRNLLSEFLGFAFLILTYAFLFLSTNKYIKIAIAIVSSLILTIIAFSLSRSVLLSLFLSLLAIAFFHFFKLNFIKKIYLCAQLLLIVALPTIIFISQSPIKSSIPDSQNKTASVNVRKARWFNSLCMLKENPLGVGNGQFEFNYTKYHHCVHPDSESLNENIIKSPHNGYLEIAIENGLLALLAICSLILYLMNLAFKKRFYNFGFIYLIYFLTDAFFAFPLETGGTFYVSMFGFALILKEIPVEKKFLSTYATNIFRLTKNIFGLLIIVGVVLSTLSHYLEFSKYHHLSKINFACQIYPSNWRACLRKAQLQIESGNFKDAIDSLEKYVKVQPYHFVYIDQLGKSYWKMGEKKKSCENVKRFDEIFLKKSHLHHFYINQCQ